MCEQNLDELIFLWQPLVRYESVEQQEIVDHSHVPANLCSLHKRFL